MLVAIHQPNYLPWLGYFAKIAQADAFIFLDDVQFSKGSYTNRVRILGGNGPRWLTVPVNVSFGDPISGVRPSQRDWPARHLDTLYGCYAGAPSFENVWGRIRDILLSAPSTNLGALNRHIIEALAGELGMTCAFYSSSQLGAGAATREGRLAALTRAVESGSTYLFGEGGSRYQDETAFGAVGIGLQRSTFCHPTYDQDGQDELVAGLSVMDAAFRLGWTETAELIGQST